MSSVDIDVPALPDHQEPTFLGCEPAHRIEEVGEQDDVGVHVAEKAERSVALQTARKAELTRGVPNWFRAIVADPLRTELGCDIVSARFIAAKNHLALWTKTRPAADCVSLDYPYVTVKGLRDCEDRQHASPSRPARGQSSRAHRAVPSGGAASAVASSLAIHRLSASFTQNSESLHTESVEKSRESLCTVDPVPWRKDCIAADRDR